MILNELTTVPPRALPVTAFSEHLHLGSGFSGDGAQDAVLEAYLRAAIAAIEARSGVVLFQRRFSWGLYGWSGTESQRMPIAPAQSIEIIRTISVGGEETVVDASRYRLQKDGTAPRLVATGGCLPHVPHHGTIEVIFEAGYGPAWEDIPADLRHAVLLLAAHQYDNRTGSDAGKFPSGVQALLEPYRVIRLSGGAA